jgi:hypothetical protein
MTKHLIRLNRGDYQRLGELHKHRTPNEVIRLLVQRHIKAIEASEPERKADVRQAE